MKFHAKTQRRKEELIFFAPLAFWYYGAGSDAHKPTFFDFTLEQLVVPFVTVTVYVPGLFTVIVSVLPPETMPPDGPLHR